MHKFIFRRLLMMVFVLLGVMFIIFSLMYITPGDAAMMRLGESAPAEALAAMRAEMRLDQPFLSQFGFFIGNVLRGNLGISHQNGRPVTFELGSRFPATLTLAGCSIIVALFVGIPLGILCAVKQYSAFDNIFSSLGLVILSMPNFWLGLILILIFSVQFGWTPVSGFGTPVHWILPALTIGLSTAGVIQRFTRSSMLEVVHQDYVKMARAKGQKESRVIIKHALKNALIPVITIVGLNFGVLLGGAILTETVFAIPGVGRFIVDSIRARDNPVVMGGVLVISFGVGFVNLIVDIAYGFVDPRIRSQYK